MTRAVARIKLKEMTRHSPNRRREQRFPVGCLVHFISDKGIPPEGFTSCGGFDMSVEEIPVGSLGIVVKSPYTAYAPNVYCGDLVSWVLVGGQVLEVPHFHLRRCDDLEAKARRLSGR